MERIDPRAVERTNGPAWTAIRPTLVALHEVLIGMSPTASGELTTIYVKYTSAETKGTPFAVVWLKKSSELVIGLALPPHEVPDDLTGPPAGYRYAGLTGYVKVTAEKPLPSGFKEWALRAFRFVSSQ